MCIFDYVWMNIAELYVCHIYMYIISLQRKKEVDEYAEEWMEVGFNLYLILARMVDIDAKLFDFCELLSYCNYLFYFLYLHYDVLYWPICNM